MLCISCWIFRKLVERWKLMSRNSCQLGGGATWCQRGERRGVHCQRPHVPVCLTTPGILLDTSGRAHPVKEMTTSSTAILLTKRYLNPSDCKSGTKRCWTSLCRSASSMITRCVKCVLGGDGPISSLPYALCLILGVYCSSFK